MLATEKVVTEAGGRNAYRAEGTIPYRGSGKSRYRGPGKSPYRTACRTPYRPHSPGSMKTAGTGASSATRPRGACARLRGELWLRRELPPTVQRYVKRRREGMTEERYRRDGEGCLTLSWLAGEVQVDRGEADLGIRGVDTWGKYLAVTSPAPTLCPAKSSGTRSPGASARGSATCSSSPGNGAVCIGLDDVNLRKFQSETKQRTIVRDADDAEAMILPILKL